MRLRIILTGILFLLAQSVTVSEAEEFEELRSRYQEKRLKIDPTSKVGGYREKGCSKGYHNAFIGYGNIGGGWSHFHGAIGSHDLGSCPR
ncbi:MAG: hypothetical protein P1U87_00985 [Verrucomicrobiales bacterium]|nr:hypothetical protein [Verrucomicrobiales bacterium]